MIKPELKTLQPVIPGHARLLLKAWKGELSGVLISVQRNQDQLFLDNNGQWGSGEVFLALPELSLDDGIPGVQIGPLLIDSLLANRQAAYRLIAKDESAREMGVLMIPDGLLSSQAGGENPLTVNVHALAEATPEPAVAAPVEVPVPTPQSAPEPQPLPPVQAPAKKSALPLIIIAALLLLIAAGVAAWWFLRSPAEPVVAAAPPTAPAPKVEGPCSDEMMTSHNDLDFVKGCLRSQPSGAQVLSIIDKAKTAKRCDIAQRLYAYKAQSGDTQIALRYAQEYDPKTATQGGCFSADAQTAIYWYESVVSQDSQNNEAKARLAELKK